MRNRNVYHATALLGILIVGPGLARAQEQEKPPTATAPAPEAAQDQKKRLRSTLPP
ncbi:MAG TPA: hypothetical protein VM490_09350 [Armatimonadaceae bacterium]|nr:hypothetical protein [Armatimonadaceae bacterium]